MIYNIKKQHYDEIFSLVEIGQLSSLDYQIEMKGTLCININGKGNENKIVEDFVSDFCLKIWENFEYASGEIYFQIENDRLFFKDVVIRANWTNGLGDNPELEYEDLLNTIKPTFEEPYLELINSENIELSLNMEGNINSMQPIYWVEMQYFNKEKDDFVEIPLSEKSMQLLIDFVHKWAIEYLVNKNENEVYTLHVESSRVSSLIIEQSIEIDLIID